MARGRPSSDGTRVRGRKGQAMRKRRLVLHPLCAECAKVGRIRATAVIDHVLPLAFGGLDVDENTQGLCEFCDAVKTAAEAAGPAAAANHPDWLRRSAIPGTIVCGPPCGGKTSYVRDQARGGDIVIDLDVIALEIDPRWSGRWNSDLLNQAIRKRNALLGALSYAAGGRFWFIVSAPCPAERQWWLDQIGGCIVVCDPGERKATALAMGRDGRSDHVKRWYSDARKPWALDRARLPKSGCDADGYPLGPSKMKGE